MNDAALKYIAWDSEIFGIDTYEIPTLTPAVLDQLKNTVHYTIKVNPLTCKKILHDYGFYYCDTLIEPFCSLTDFVFHQDTQAHFSKNGDFNKVMSICQNVFLHGRFHRDFNIEKKQAELRYSNWLKQLYESGNVYTLYYAETAFGFIAHMNNKLVLHAVDSAFQGKGLAKYVWSLVCMDLYNQGHKEIISSISAANLAAVNLYVSLGFRFRNSIDVYHRMVR